MMEYYNSHKASKLIGVTSPCIRYRVNMGLIEGAYFNKETGHYCIPKSYIDEILKQMESRKEYLSASEAARAVFLSVNAMHHRLQKGKVEGAKKVFGRWSIPFSYIEKERSGSQ